MIKELTMGNMSLPVGWELKKIDDVCIIKGRIGYRGYTKQDLVSKGEGAISLSPSNIKNNKLFFDKCTYLSWDKYEESPEIMIFPGDIIYCKTASIGKMALVEQLPEKSTLNPQFVVLKQINCNNKFLYYFMSSEDFKNQIKNIIGGTAIPTLSQKNLGNLNLPIPSLKQQKQIVTILDKAFVAIDTAKANAEQNLQNAKELFESYLQNVFENKGDDWVEKRFDEICVLQRGFDLPTRLRKEGDYPLVSSNGITDYVDVWKVKSPGVSTGRSGTIGNVHYIEEDYFPLNTSLYIKDFHGNDERCIYYFLKQFDLSRFQSGAGVPTLNRNNVHPEKVYFPISKEEQKQIVNKLEALSVECKKLETIYTQKIADLEEMKKSVLQKAFSGQLNTIN